MSELPEDRELAITDEEQARLKAVEIMKTAEEAEPPEDMALAVRRIAEATFGGETEPVKGTDGNPETVTAGAPDPTDAGQDKLGRLKRTLAAQYDEMDIQGSKPPFENVLNKFGKNKLEIADTYDTPYLLMLPVKKNNKIRGYRPVIAEGKQEMDPYEGDDLKANLEDRIATRWENREDCESGMTKIIYEPLFKAAKKAGKPIDRRFGTMMEDDYNEGDPLVPVAYSVYGRPCFFTRFAVFPVGSFRFRSSVAGDVLTI